ncbi:MAG: Holliday junction branch migration protein RuvA [Tenericutes bacterium HGW-Tenericutes-2]|jgi:Holliday junction DNA helicase RuvA|nr:MAG: Holliday junction branch migration protein RuvA [Tenericutes bacterium HGW-Tenericutes-2]
MYAWIEGTIKEIKPSYLVIENQGIGYLIISPNPYNYHIGDHTRIYTHHYVREDINNLYGFSSLESKELFIRLIGVSGIGPKSALSILATDAITDIIIAIEEGNAKYLTKFPGIGIKSAQQIILDLKGKLVDTDDELIPSHKNDVEDALSALGYSKVEVRKVMKKIDQDQPVEKMIKQALQLLLK